MISSKLIGQHNVKLNGATDARIFILPAIPTSINDAYIAARYRNAAKQTTPQNVLSRWSNLARTELMRRGLKPIAEPSALIVMDMQPCGLDRGLSFVEYSEMLSAFDGVIVSDLSLLKTISVSFAEWDKPPLLIGLITRDLSFQRNSTAEELVASFELILDGKDGNNGH